MKFAASCIVMLLFAINIYGQNPFQGIEMGINRESVKSTAKDISNPQSWEETEFEIDNPPYTLFNEIKLSKCKLTFYNNRLFKITGYIPRNNFDIVYRNFAHARGAASNPELNKKDKSANWYGPFKDFRYENSLLLYQFYEHTLVVYTEESQKDFRFTDLFKGSLFWVIVTFIGLFAGYMLFGYLVTSRCPKCKSWSLKSTGTTYDNPTDYDPSLFGNDVHWDQVYHYKCKKCGYEKDDVYSGYWSWFRNRNND